MTIWWQAFLGWSITTLPRLRKQVLWRHDPRNVTWCLGWIFQNYLSEIYLIISLWNPLFGSFCVIKKDLCILFLAFQPMPQLAWVVFRQTHTVFGFSPILVFTYITKFKTVWDVVILDFRDMSAFVQIFSLFRRFPVITFLTGTVKCCSSSYRENYGFRLY